MRTFTVTITTIAGTRIVTSCEAADGFDAVNITLEAYGDGAEDQIKRIAAINVRPVVHGTVPTAPGAVSPSLPVVCVEGYRGKGR